MWRRITLVTPVEGEPENGIPTVRRFEFQIYANSMSVKRQEYYTAMKAGDWPTVTFELWEREFENAHIKTDCGDFKRLHRPTEIVMDGVRYKIGRVYHESGTDKTELTCSEIM